MCYTPCEHDADGVGPVCWGSCPAGTTECGGALCLTPDQNCSDYVTGDFKDIFKLAIAIAEGSGSGTVIDISKIALDYTFPNCPTWSFTPAKQHPF